MSKEIEITPSTVRVNKVSIDQFMSDMREIIDLDPELRRANVSSAVLAVPGGTINLGRAGDDSFNVSTSVPPMLERLIAAMKKFYKSKQGT